MQIGVNEVSYRQTQAALQAMQTASTGSQTALEDSETYQASN